MISKKSFISITTFVFLIGLHFLTYGAVFALGTSGDIGLNTVKKDTQWRDVKQGITENPKIRTTVLENANKLSPQMLDDLLNDVKLRPKFFSSANFSKFTTYIRDIQRYTHIFMGDETGGWHYRLTGRSGSKISNPKIGKNGVYKADVEIMIDGKLLPPKPSIFSQTNGKKSNC